MSETDQLAQKQFQLEQLKRERDQAIADLNAYVYRVSHDFAGPIRAIQTASMILIEDFSEVLPPAAVEEMNRQSAAAQRLSRMVAGLLEWSRLGNPPIQRTRFRLAPLLEAELRKLDPDNIIQLSADPSLETEADRDRFLVLIRELVKNAIGAGATSISLHGKDGKFELDDNGEGLTHPGSESLFAPFVSVGKPGTAPRTGMGLALAHRVVTLHQGEISISNRPECGCRVQFTLDPLP